jgi:acyl-CoA reductase-like NAD-dependent aldehyde dehydrogenase
VTEPVGVVAAFTPWNFPTLTPVQDLGALAAGCSIIVKASEETPGSCRAGEVFAGGRRAPARRAQPRVRRAGKGLPST